MHISAIGMARAIDRLTTREQTADEDDTILTSGQSAAAEIGHTERLRVPVMLSQAAIASLNGTTSQNSEASTQIALFRIDQIMRPGNSAAKVDAETRVENLKAQMQQILEMKALMSPHTIHSSVDAL